MPESEPKPTPWSVLTLLSLGVGTIAGFGAVVFRGMIGTLHDLLFLGELSFAYDANVHTVVSPWGAWIIGVPVLGAIGVAFLVKTFAPEAKGHGVPEVMAAIHRHDGRIRPLVAVIKSLASALSIGSGGSVGREGPIIQIGAAFGSTLGQLVRMPARQRAILIGAGAGGGIAATFNTPIGGIVFAVELILPSIGPMSLLCVAISCVTATQIGRAFFGDVPSFHVDALISSLGPGTAASIFPWFALFGALIGAVAWLTTRGIYWFEDLFDAMPGNYYTRHMSGMLIVGLMLYAFANHSSAWLGQPDHYYIEGVGYATLMDILRGSTTAVGFLCLLGAAKLLATCLTLGSGASGGIFSPCMFIGGALGAGFAGGLQSLVPGVHLDPVHFAIAGMAAMVGGTTGAVVTATIMIFEMTRDYSVILPVILTVSVAAAVAHALLPSTIYTLKLLRRGEIVPQGLQGRTSGLRSRHVMSTDLGSPSAWEPAHVSVGPDAYFDDVLRAMRDAGVRVALVKASDSSGPGAEVLGVIGDREIAAVHSAAARMLE